MAGRPTKFKDEYISEAYKLCLLGATDAHLADFFGVHVDTIDEWKRKYPLFSESLKKGKYIADAEIAQSLYNRAKGCRIKTQQAVKLTTKKPNVDPETGKSGRSMMQTEEVVVVDLEQEVPPDTTAAIFWLKNRQPREWRDKQEVVQRVVEMPDIKIQYEPYQEIDFGASKTSENQ